MSTRSQCLTLESRKIDCALYNIFDQKLDPSVSYLDDKKGSTGMTLSVVQFTFKNECLYSYSISYNSPNRS
ncbi:hypothetical protein [Wolbachia endosymbiont (group A) of Lasioglossum morio]|uniref:hypothetical protein n=1 Tax=Wolbachia endosymbiont (group A) of Lasioglossum morio TaxID=2954025 RepID=UPI0022273134|nr:hypothetical protein [Wolbachia endosymbiont (group A) of Lasioglossum morio]